MTTKMLLLAAVLCICSCTKDNSAGNGFGGDTHFEVSVDCDDRTYDYHETAQALVTVQTHNARNDRFLLSAEITGGSASLTVEGESLTSGVERLFDYSIINAGVSSATLHVSVTPDVNAAAAYGLNVRLRISTPDGGAATEQLLHIDIINRAQIEVTAKYDPAAIELEQTLGIILSANKEHFSGSFTVTPSLLEGDGFLRTGGKDYYSGEPFEVAPQLPCTISYQPITRGAHKIRLTVTDGTISTDVDVRVEVYNQGGLSNPENGIYIYAQNLYFTLQKWNPEAAIIPEGVAILADECRFLLAPKPGEGIWCEGNYLLLLPDLTTTTQRTEALKDFNGRKNTEALMQALDQQVLARADLAKYCYNFDKDAPGKWYMPAAGQLALIAKNITEIQSCIQLIGGTPFTNEYMNYSYMSSTGCGKYNAWCLDYTNQSYATIETASIDNRTNCYPVCDLQNL